MAYCTYVYMYGPSDWVKPSNIQILGPWTDPSPRHAMLHRAASPCVAPPALPYPPKANLRTKILDFRGLDSSRILSFKGWNPQVQRGFPGKFESTNPSGDNLSREIGRTARCGATRCDQHWHVTRQSSRISDRRCIYIYIYVYIYIYIRERDVYAYTCVYIYIYTYIHIYIYTYSAYHRDKACGRQEALDK